MNCGPKQPLKKKACSMRCRLEAKELTAFFKAAADTRPGQKWLFLLLYYREQLDFEYQGFSGTNVSTRSPIAISQLGRDEQLPFGSHWHELERFGPAFNHAAHRERRR